MTCSLREWSCSSIGRNRAADTGGSATCLASGPFMFSRPRISMTMKYAASVTESSCPLGGYNDPISFRSHPSIAKVYFAGSKLLDSWTPFRILEGWGRCGKHSSRRGDKHRFRPPWSELIIDIVPVLKLVWNIHQQHDFGDWYCQAKMFGAPEIKCTIRHRGQWCDDAEVPMPLIQIVHVVFFYAQLYGKFLGHSICYVEIIPSFTVLCHTFVSSTCIYLYTLQYYNKLKVTFLNYDIFPNLSDYRRIGCEL